MVHDQWGMREYPGRMHCMPNNILIERRHNSLLCYLRSHRNKIGEKKAVAPRHDRAHTLNLYCHCALPRLPYLGHTQHDYILLNCLFYIFFFFFRLLSSLIFYDGRSKARRSKRRSKKKKKSVCPTKIECKIKEIWFLFSCEC